MKTFRSQRRKHYSWFKMTEKCEDCGQVPPQTPHEETMNHLMMCEDEDILGYSMECDTCGTRMNPLDPEDEKNNDDVKFLEEDSIVHGME